MTRLKAFFAFFIFLLALLPVDAQESALVRPDDLSFNSDFEKKAFIYLNEGQADFLQLFLAISPASDSALYRKAMQNIKIETERIRSKKYEKLKPEKKVERVYEIVNQDVLNLYKESILFPEIFADGRFNCLTASAYYGLLFKELGIDFDFKVSANHVHPVAFPNDLQIKVETTDPLYGFQYFDNKVKGEYVSYLLSNKIISKEDFANSSTETIFNQYYFPESSIGFMELAGLQYINDAFYNLILSNYTYAFRQSQKAHFLYPSEKSSSVILFLLTYIISELDYDSVDDAYYLAFASRFLGKSLKKEDIVAEYYKLTDKVLSNSPQLALYEQITEYLLKNIDSDEVRKEIEVEYNYNKGKTLLGSYRLKEALSCFEKALSLQPENTELQAYTVQCLVLGYQTVSSQDVVSNLETFAERYPQMQTNMAFITLQMLAYLRLSEEMFDFNKPLDGESLLKKFEDLYFSVSDNQIHYEMVGNAYSAAAAYYFKRNEIAKARSAINRGLKISPGNYQLNYRLRAFD